MSRFTPLYRNDYHGKIPEMRPQPKMPIQKQPGFRIKTNPEGFSFPGGQGHTVIYYVDGDLKLMKSNDGSPLEIKPKSCPLLISREDRATSIKSPLPPEARTWSFVKDRSGSHHLSRASPDDKRLSKSAGSIGHNHSPNQLSSSSSPAQKKRSKDTDHIDDEQIRNSALRRILPEAEKFNSPWTYRRRTTTTGSSSSCTDINATSGIIYPGNSKSSNSNNNSSGGAIKSTTKLTYGSHSSPVVTSGVMVVRDNNQRPASLEHRFDVMVTPITSSTKSHQEHVDSDITSPSEAGDPSPAEDGEYYCDDDREDSSPPRFDYEAIKELSDVVGTALSQDLQLRVSVESGISINYYNDLVHNKSTGGRGSDNLESTLIQQLQLHVQNTEEEEEEDDLSDAALPSLSTTAMEEEEEEAQKDPPTNTEIEMNFRELCL